MTGRHARRAGSVRAWIAAFFVLALAGAIALVVGSAAQAEAAKKTVTLTLTGMIDSECQIATGGTTAYIKPGGTVTLKPSLAGASVTVPDILLGSVTIPLDSSQISAFSFVVTVHGKSHTLTTAKDTLALKNIRSTTNLAWKATGITLAAGLVKVPFNGSNVHLPAGGELDWSGKIVPKSNSNCGIAVAVPTGKVSVPGHTVTVPGTAVTVTNPVPSVLSKVKSVVNKATGALNGATSTKPAGGSGAGGGSVNYTPPKLTVPQRVMPNANHVGGSGGTGFAAPGAGAAGGGIANASETSPAAGAPSTPDASPAAKKKNIDLSQRTELGGKQLPALLAIAAILALSVVTSVYARMTLLRKH